MHPFRTRRAVGATVAVLALATAGVGRRPRRLRAVRVRRRVHVLELRLSRRRDAARDVHQPRLREPAAEHQLHPRGGHGDEPRQRDHAPDQERLDRARPAAAVAGRGLGTFVERGVRTHIRAPGGGTVVLDAGYLHYRYPDGFVFVAHGRHQLELEGDIAELCAALAG